MRDASKPLPRGETYRGFVIGRSSVSYHTKTDWCWVHRDYDGAKDSRWGHAANVADAKRKIDAWRDEESV